MLRKRLYLGIGVLLICGHAAMAQAVAQEPPTVQAAGEIGSLALTGGDKIKITVFNVPEITGEYALSPTGEISLPLLGSLKASGMTTDGLVSIISKKLANGYVNDPKVSIEVLNFRPFYIFGEVNHPGEFPYKASLTVEQAIATAGGYTYRASRRKAYLRHTGHAEQLVKFGVQSIYVLPGDTIRIGERYF